MCLNIDPGPGPTIYEFTMQDCPTLRDGTPIMYNSPAPAECPDDSDGVSTAIDQQDCYYALEQLFGSNVTTNSELNTGE